MKKGLLTLGLLASLAGAIIALVPACCCDRSCPAKCEPADDNGNLENDGDYADNE